jgi:DNA uptake protein ComE-like DNA-binding protein
LDLNEASVDDLRAVEGLGDYADRILDERPFRTKIDLLERMIVPDEVYNEIKDRIVVRHAA